MPWRFIFAWYLFFHMKNACSRAGSVVTVLQGKFSGPAIGGVALSQSRGHTSERGVEGRYGRSSIGREKVQEIR